MKCRNCGGEATPGNRYCPWCGTANPVPGEPEAPQPSGEPTTGESPDATEDELRQLRVAVNSMTSELARLSLRLETLERQRAAGSAPAIRPPERPTPPPQREGQPAAPTPSDSLRPTPTPATQPVAPSSMAAAQPVASREALASLQRATPNAATQGPEVAADGDSGGGAPRPPFADFVNWNWEWLLGGNWLARVGVVALIFGVAFFISLAIDRGWLGETERVAVGIAGGLAILGAGEYWRRRYAVWAQTVTGGGLAILYLSVYGAFALYQLISPLAAFGAFSVITLAGALLSLRHEAVAVAVFSIFGGFATPLLLQERLPDQRLLLAYVLVLDVGVLALAGFRNWRWFTLLAWVGSLILLGFWQQELDPPTGLAQIGNTAIFLIFAAATLIFHILRRQPSNIADLVLITLNAAAYYGISYFLIYDEYRPWMGGFTAALAAFYAGIAAGCRMRGASQLNLTLFSAGLAVVFAVLAVPIQLGGPWISIAWGIEGLVLIWLSFPLGMRELRWSGYAMFAVSAVWMLVLDTPDAFGEDLTPFLNEYMISFAGAVILPALAARLLHLRRDLLEPWEQAAIPVLALRAAGFAALAVPVQVDGIWIVVGWAIEAAALLWLSFPLGIREVRWAGYAMYLVCSAWLYAVDSPGAYRKDLTPFLNLYTLGYSAAVLSGVFSAWLLWWKLERLERYEQVAYPVFAVGAAVAGAAFVPVQLEWPWITVAWAAEALLLLQLSLTLQTREIRWFGYVLFGVFSLWLLGWDTSRALGEEFTVFLNWHMMNHGVAIIASVAAACILWRRREALAPYERRAWVAFSLAAGVFAAVAAPVQFDGVWTSIAWAVEAVMLLALSMRLGIREMRWLGYGLLGAMVVRLLALDTFDVDLDAFRPVLNWRFLAFASGIAAVYSAAWLALRRPADPDSPVEEMESRAALPALLALANLVTLWLFSAEIISSAYSALFDLPEDVAENVASLGLSLLWAVYAAAMIVLGVARRWRWVRLAGLALLAVPVIKLFAFDSRHLEQEYRVIAFLALGLILVAGGLLYQRYSRLVRGFLFE